MWMQYDESMISCHTVFKLDNEMKFRVIDNLRAVTCVDYVITQLWSGDG